MNPGAIYSKSGKGVQEASGKTSLLKRADRAVLSAIDGRATLAEVAQKVGRPFDAAFEALINQLDKDGFVRAVATGDTFPPAARSAGTPTVKRATGHDLDFTSIIPASAMPPKPGDAAQRVKEQESALYKARQEAEARAHAERERLKAEAEGKARAEMEAKARADAEKKVREEAEARSKAEAEAKAKAAREAALRMAAEAKAKADAEKARLEAERKAREEAERRAREEAERQARQEAERKAREEAERKAREEAERKAREEVERKAREEAERKAREEAERKAREEEERRARAEAERRAREEEERRAREEEERRAREEQERRAREEEEERVRRAHEEELERARREAEQAQAPAEREPAPESSTAATVVPGSLDTLMKDLDFFDQHEEEDRKSREAAERKDKEEARRLREESEQRAREQADAERRQAEERRRKDEENRRAQEEAQRRAREAEAARKKEAEARERKAREEAAAAVAAAQVTPPSDDIGISAEDLDMEDVRRDEALVAKDSRKAQREKEREAKERERGERQREHERERAERERERRRAAEPVKPSKPRRPVKWGKAVATTLVVLLAAAVGVLHIVPIPTEPYERAASQVFGHPVHIGSARLSLYKGLRLNLERVKIGETVTLARVSAYPEIGSLFGDRKAFSRIDVENAALAPQGLGEALFAKMKGTNFSVGRIVVKQLKIEGGFALPVVEADATSGPDGAVHTVLLRGQDNVLGKITPNGNNIEFEVTASSFPLPVAPSVALNSFAMKGSATRQGMDIASWGGGLYDGALNGVANVRWDSAGWHVDGVVAVRNVNAAVFAPALLSEGRAEGTAKFSMSAPDPAKLADGSRVEGKFSVHKGALGSFDLSRLIQTSGRQSSGRTQFAEMTGQGTYDRGAVALRDVQISAGALNAGASADISRSGALSGRIVADVKTATQTLRQTIVLGGTVKEPQAR